MNKLEQHFEAIGVDALDEIKEHPINQVDAVRAIVKAQESRPIEGGLIDGGFMPDSGIPRDFGEKSKLPVWGQTAEAA